MNRRFLGRMAATLGVALMVGLSLPARAADEAPDAMIGRLSDEVLNILRNDKSLQNGDIQKIVVLVDKIVMPNVNFRRMTAAAVGPAWRQATPAQQQRLQDEFKTLLVRTYSGALAQVGLPPWPRATRATPANLERHARVVGTSVQADAHPGA